MCDAIDRLIQAHFLARFDRMEDQEKNNLKMMSRSLDVWRSTILQLLSDEQREKLRDLLEDRKPISQLFLSDLASTVESEDEDTEEHQYSVGDIVEVSSEDDEIPEYAEILQQTPRNTYRVSWLESIAKLTEDGETLVEIKSGKSISLECFQSYILTSSVQSKNEPVHESTIQRLVDLSLVPRRFVTDKRYIYHFGIVDSRPGEHSPQYLDLIEKTWCRTESGNYLFVIQRVGIGNGARICIPSYEVQDPLRRTLLPTYHSLFVEHLGQGHVIGVITPELSTISMRTTEWAATVFLGIMHFEILSWQRQCCDARVFRRRRRMIGLTLNNDIVLPPSASSTVP